jgi:uncharacterized protein YceK
VFYTKKLKGSKMQKTLLITIMISTLFVGCATVTKPVIVNGYKPDGGYKFTKLENSASRWGVLGVFEKNDENKERVITSIDEVNNEFLKTKIKKEDRMKVNKIQISHQKIVNMCSTLVRSGVFGIYRNAIERNQLEGICYNENRNMTEDYYSGVRLTSHKQRQESGLLYSFKGEYGDEGKLKSSTIFVHLREQGDKMVVLVSGSGYIKRTDHLMAFVNRAAQERFDANGLKNTADLQSFDVESSFLRL